jgi:sugar phosphate isomerase/epimerase
MRLILILVVIMTGLLSSCTTSASSEKEVFIQLYSVRDAVAADLPATIQSLSEMGFTGVEAAGYANGKFYGLAPEAFRQLIEDHGMKLLSSHAHRQLAKEPVSTDWDAIWSWWDEAILAHQAAGITSIVVPWMPKPETLADLQVYCDYYNAIGERCNKAGLMLGYHNHAFEFNEIEGEIMYDYMLRNTHPAKVFFQMDVYWVVKGGKNPIDYFIAYPGRFTQLHLKDEMELGQSGMVDFSAILKSLELAGTTDLIVEVEKYSMDPLESVSQSLKYLKGIL